MRHERLLVTALAAIALALRLVVAGDSPFGDEIFTYEIATRDSLTDVIDGVAGDLEITPPLFFVMAWLFQQLGDPDFWLRVPSILAGTLLVPVTWAIGRRTVGPAAGLVGAALMALSPFAIFYSTEARAYALMALLAALATYALVRAVSQGGWRWWGAYAAAAAAALYTHYTAVFALGVHALWALWFHREQLRALAGAYIAVLVAYIPWIPEVIDDRGNKVAQDAIGVLAPFGVETFFEHLARWSFGSAYISPRDLPGTPLLVALLLLLAAAALAGARRLEWRPETALVAGLAAGAPVGAAVWTVLAEGSIFIDRNLIVALPALTLAAGAVLTAAPHRYALPLAGAFVAIFAWLAIYSTQDRFSRPNYEAAGDYISAHAEANDPALDMTVLTTVGPPSDQLAVHLGEQRTLFKTHVAFPNSKTRVAALSAARGGRLYVVTPGSEPELPEGRGRTRVVTTKKWPGRFDIRLTVIEVDAALRDR